MTYTECTMAALNQMVNGAVATKHAADRGDPPERIQDYLSDVIRWCQRSLADVNSDTPREQPLRLASHQTTADETAEAERMADKFRPAAHRGGKPAA